MIDKDIIFNIIEKSVESVKCGGKLPYINKFFKTKDSYLVEDVSMEPIEISSTLTVTDEDEIMRLKGMKKDRYKDSDGNLIYYGVMELRQDKLQKKVNYPQEEFAGVNHYSCNDYRLINGKLDPDGEYGEYYRQREGMSDYVDDNIRWLDSAIEMSPPLSDDSVLYRYGALPDGIVVGDVDRFKGFTSTSYQEGTVEKFKNGYYGDLKDRYKLKIYAPAGSKGVLVNDTFEAIKEHEWLLPRNQRYYVVSIDEKNMEAELLLLPDKY